MSESSYEFDPCSIDGSDQEEEPVKMDDWKPGQKKPNIVQSEWRKNKIGKNFNQQPDLDDLKKIVGFLKKKVADAEIMQTFGITAETLVAIKKDKYDPIDGISMDNQSKIYKEFKRLQDMMEAYQRGLNFFASTLFGMEEGYKKALLKPKPKKKNVKKDDEYDENSEFCEENADLSSEEE
jgi:hypothetical protein